MKVKNSQPRLSQIDKSFLPAAEGVGPEFHRPLRAHCDMLSTLRHRGGKRKVGESGAAADEGPDDGDGYAVKMLQRLLDVARPKQATSRSLADTLELVVEEWSVHAAKLQGGTYNIVGGKERANAKRHLRNESETKSVMSMVLDAAGTDELPQASRCCHCRCRT